MSVVSYVNRPAPLPLEAVVALAGNEPSVAAFDFITGRAWVRDQAAPAKNYLGGVNGFLTYASPSPKRILNKQGQLESGTTLRCEYDAAGVPEGLRLEGQRTNLFAKSEFPDGLSNLSQYSNVTASLGWVNFPSGPTQAWAYKDMGVLPTPNTAYTLSFDIEYEDGGAPVFGSPTGSSVLNDFNIVIGGSLVQPTNEYKVTHLGGVRYRVATSGITPASIASIRSGPVRQATHSGRGFRVTAYQFEQADSASSYIKTEAAAVTRAADNVDLSADLLPIMKNGDGNTVIFDLRMYRPASSSRMVGPAFGRADNNRIVAALYSGGNFITQEQPAGSTGGTVGSFSPPVALNTRYKIALAFKDGQQIRAVNGSASTPENTIRMDDSKIGKLVFAGDLLGGNNREQSLRMVKIVPRIMSIGEMIRETML